MEFLYELGLIKLFKHDNLPFVVISNTLTRDSLDIIGCYQDKNGVVKRIRKDSVHGKMILDICCIKKEALSQDAVKLREIINGLSSKMNINAK